MGPSIHLYIRLYIYTRSIHPSLQPQPLHSFNERIRLPTPQKFLVGMHTLSYSKLIIFSSKLAPFMVLPILANGTTHPQSRLDLKSRSHPSFLSLPCSSCVTHICQFHLKNIPWSYSLLTNCPTSSRVWAIQISQPTDAASHLALSLTSRPRPPGFDSYLYPLLAGLNLCLRFHSCKMGVAIFPSLLGLLRGT